MQGNKPSVQTEVFQAMQNVDIAALNKCKERDLRAVLPCLVRMALCKPLDESEEWTSAKKEVLKILSGIEVVNNIVALLSIDFHALEQDVRKEQQLRTKLGGNHTESILISQLQEGLTLEFERSDPARRIRLLLSELLFVGSQIKESSSEFYLKQSELFDSTVYLEEVSDVLCIAQAELPTLLPINEVAETLLHVPNGDWLLCRLVSNSPDCFLEVCSSLVSNGEKQDEETVGGRRRMEVLQSLCTMNPKEALNVRAMCVNNCTMPALAVSLTLKLGHQSQNVSMDSEEETNDLVAFVSGLLLSNDLSVRNWFSQFVKMGQKRKRDLVTSKLHALRLRLLEQLIAILPDTGGTIPENKVIQASSFIRLYCALKGMAALRFTDEEMKLLLRLVTSKPSLSKSGARFVCLGLCMLIACPYLLGNPEQEKQAVEWIRWLMDTERQFEIEVGSQCSFGEMLFLIAIHFHSNQTPAIAELVCTTLGMKSAVKANALARIRQIFTQEIFTEQVITSHAVRVPVTPNLNANMTGYLPINSIYQLLKSRSFSKHKVPIKDWIYRQVCQSSVPLHPLLPSLIEVYVNSIVVKSTKTDHLNEPFTIQEILDVYKHSVFKSSETEKLGKSNLAPQLVTLFYVLQYEDTLLNNMKIIVSSNLNMKTYPDTVLEQVPINFLLREAQKEQQLYAGMFSPLVRLLVTHFPHLCAVEDWLEEILNDQTLKSETSPMEGITCNHQTFTEALDCLISSPSKMLIQLQTMLKMPINKLLTFTDAIVKALPQMLKPNIPRRILDLTKKVWFRLHIITPRSLRLATINALSHTEKVVFKIIPYTDNDITVDPLIILRCDERVYRCPPVLEIILRILAAYMQACKVYLQNHMQTNPVLDNASQNEQERRDLKNALIAAQDSAVVQILLECCLPKDNEKESGLLDNLREVQCIICSFIHQMFIADPNLAKLVHFQGYPDDLLPVTVAGIPSIHICLDFVPELLSQPQRNKQIFAIKLMSYLSCQYALPKSLSIAKLAVSCMFTMIGVLEKEERADFFLETIPFLVKVCQAFPPLCEDSASLLSQVGRVCYSDLTASGNISESNVIDSKDDKNLNGFPCGSPEPPKKKQKLLCSGKNGLSSKYQKLYTCVKESFSDIVRKAVVTRNIYS